jgi:hypothetical protein
VSHRLDFGTLGGGFELTTASQFSSSPAPDDRINTLILLQAVGIYAQEHI